MASPEGLQPQRATERAVPSLSQGRPWIMWAGAHHEVQPISFYRGQMTLAQVASFGHKAQLACSAELSQQRVPQGLEVSVSRSGPPRPTDSEQRGQPRGPCRRPTPHQTKTHPQRKHDTQEVEEERTNRKTSRPCAPFRRK